MNVRQHRRELRTYQVVAWLLFAGLLVTCQEMRRLYGKVEADRQVHAVSGFATHRNAAGGQGNPFSAPTR